jgi:hypothetical protein
MSRFETRREAELRELRTVGPVVAASLCERRVRCGNANCKCARGEKHSSWCLTFKHQGRTRTVHVPRAMLPEVKQWVKEYRRVKQLLQQISYQSLQIIRGHVRERRAAARVSAKS